MKKVRILRKLRLSEISIVDNPAQPDARIGILKRKTEDADKQVPSSGENEDTPEQNGSASDQPTIRAANSGNSEGDPMTPEEKAAQEAANKVQELEKRAQRAEAICKMTASQRSHFDGLTAEDQDTFLAKSNEDRDRDVENAQAADPIVYKSIDGVEYRKSTDATLLSLVKSNDELRKANDENQRIAKRAGHVTVAREVLKNHKGDEGTKADLIEAIDALPTEKREKVVEMLKAHDGGLGEALKTRGHADTSSEDSSPDAQLDALAKRHASEKSISFDEAMTQVLNTDEGAQLYAKRFQV